VTMIIVGDYLLWNWSLGGNHEVLALVAGLTLPPLAAFWLWMCACAMWRALVSSTERRTQRADHGIRRERLGTGVRARARRSHARQATASREDPATAPASSGPPRKLAA